MSHKSDVVIDKALKDPEKAYKTPAAVLLDTRLSTEEKEKVLESWEQDQLALIRAEEENMTATPGAEPATALLDKVKEAEKVLEDATGEKTP